MTSLNRPSRNHQTSASKNSSVKIGSCLPSIDKLRRSETSPTSMVSGYCSSTIMPTSKAMNVRQRAEIGIGFGKAGLFVLSNTKPITIPIVRDQEGVIAFPMLEPSENLFLNGAVRQLDYVNPSFPKIPDEKEEIFARIYVQASASFKPAAFDKIVMRLARLRAIKASKNADKEDLKLILSELTRILMKDDLPYWAIDQGIDRLIQYESNVYFPDISVIRHHTWKVRDDFNKKLNMLGKLLADKREGVRCEGVL